ncbi:hypothetical protein AK830_g9314 [Neonectria ditissima]|uniref:BZIP domain-containing protein n=1 Tax=Neonectria ditissima TaxID=78410 RepID=A0A0P7BA46_9HYPO|nr:hypothetical protein AK830_g9314 [Neonectria ditissima]
MASSSSTPFYGPYVDESQTPCLPEYPPVEAMGEDAFPYFNTMANDAMFGGSNIMPSGPTLDGSNVEPNPPWDPWWVSGQFDQAGFVQDSDVLTPNSGQTSFFAGEYPFEANPFDHSTWPSPDTAHTPMTSIAGENDFKAVSVDSQQQDLGGQTFHPAQYLIPTPAELSPAQHEAKSPPPPWPELSKSRSHRGRSDSIDDGKPDKMSEMNSTDDKDKRSSKAGQIDGINYPELAPDLPLQQPEPATTIQQRNRIASNKCRTKKKEDTEALQLKAENLERINGDLTKRRDKIMHDIWLMKMHLMQHNNCDCELIQKYISDAVKSLVFDKSEEPSLETGVPNPQPQGEEQPVVVN